MSKRYLKLKSLLLLALICAGAFALTLTYRIAETKESANKPEATFVGSDICAGCHDEVQGQLDKHFHGKAMMEAEKKGDGHLCEGCHGPGSLHIDNPGAETAAQLVKMARNGKGCLSCHAAQLSPSKWQRSEHQHNGVGCFKCHMSVTPSAAKIQAEKTGKETHSTAKVAPEKVLPHGELNPKPTTKTCMSCHIEKNAEFSLPAHHPVKEGRVECADCHDPHKPMGKDMQKKLCQSCHAKQSGPFRFEHGAISGNLTDACLDCHRPHGSPNKSLLKLTNRGLCLQCHGDKVNHFSGQNCTNCHRAVHGSNDDERLFAE